MNRLTISCVVLFLAVCHPGLRAQIFTIGAGSGINFSDIHNAGTTGAWKPKPGPSAGLFARWSITPVLGLQTGLDYSTVYYEYHPYVTDPGPIFYPMGSSSVYPAPGYIIMPVLQSSNHTFLTAPLQITVTVPSTPSVTLGAGMFWSAIPDQDSNISYGFDDLSSDTDHGYLFSMALDLPLTEDIDLFTRGRYLTGRRLFIDGRGYKHGYSDLVAGLSFRIGGGRIDEDAGEVSVPEINDGITMSWHTGIALSWNSGNVMNDRYSVYAGPSAGFSAGFRLGDSKTWFSTGLILERVGYSMRDSSDSYYRYNVQNGADYRVDTRTSSDYAVIPAMLDFRIGGREMLCLSLGPWFAARLNSQCRGLAVREYDAGTSFRRTEITVNDDITELTRRNDFGVMVGADLILALTANSRLCLGLKFRQGIPEIMNLESANVEPGDAENQLFIRSRVVSLQAGLTVPVFRTGRK